MASAPVRLVSFECVFFLPKGTKSSGRKMNDDSQPGGVTAFLCALMSPL